MFVFTIFDTDEHRGTAATLQPELAARYARERFLTSADYALLSDEARDAVARAVPLVCVLAPKPTPRPDGRRIRH